MAELNCFIAGRWLPRGGALRPLPSAVTGRPVAELGDGPLDTEAALAHARAVGGPAIRRLSFHDRARRLKALALYLRERRAALYPLSHETGATDADNLADIDGGIGTLLVYASKGRREMPDDFVLPDGDLEQLSRDGSFLGQHYCTARTGAAVQINAFNFPVWGMLEKFAPAFLAGMPSIAKPATATAWLAEACVRLIDESGILPAGALQLVVGDTGDLLDRLGPQDLVAFTGSADTAARLRARPAILGRGVPFNAEQDSLNASVLGPDVAPGSEEFEIFLEEARREITAKAGQKCTAIRRILAPAPLAEALAAALAERLDKVSIGAPSEGVDMGPLASLAQRADVRARAERIAAEAQLVTAPPERLQVVGASAETGAFLAPMLFYCPAPASAEAVHDVEAFGPVATVMPYADPAEAIALANRGRGSLVASVITRDGAFAREVVLGAGAFHGRLYFTNRDSRAAATGHGAPLPHMVHGGPGRAGGGEELGGLRAVRHHMQRTAVQAPPDLLTAIGGTWVPGSREIAADVHPFRKPFGALTIGETLHTPPRTVTQEDIEHFAEFTGDRFYAHLDEEAAAANPFFPGRVAHGYLLLSFAAGLFVDPAPGPVLANTGLEGLAFETPVVPGDAISVRLVVKRKTPRTDSYGEVRWDVTLTNQRGERVASYELRTMNACDAP